MTNDPAIEWLLANAPTGGNTLWLCDEHFYNQSARLPNDHNEYITNRFDIARQLKGADLPCHFNDFDVRHIADYSRDAIVYRISKEKPVVHHVIEQAAKKLKPSGLLLIAGLKSEGAKSILEHAAKTLGAAKGTRKEGLAYCAILSSQAEKISTSSNYSELRTHPILPQYFTKPGQFGWQKVDAGSEFLISTLESQTAIQQAGSLLDLGCGYGFLALESLNRVLTHRPATIVLTDNNAAALVCAQKNTEYLAQCDVIAADVGDEVRGQFDLIVCNPPFHQGFQLSGDLTDRFLTSTKRLLKQGGHAYFVVNAFIPLESKAHKHFEYVNLIANNNQFKVVELKHF
ncbi:methyltransferase [Gilvimarinus sp. SDUM040013]|uniref:Methyltransferase n=1 Tax=Gilvimarinus gilvus TaxID=3058038 RepID=A0ABU4RXW2_9GAMM|nr:methyltransferase [Gilvimarinus sp. SDUM040013]MDO3386468.1 methyltransferase [Gilvimarinus sp. SDUM040013]MDX6849734.1 methyltransferase [Gilvimarinus sp. SDUM040013]